MPLSEVQMPPPGPTNKWTNDCFSQLSTSSDLQGPFCHTRIPVKEQKDGGLYKRDWSVI